MGSVPPISNAIGHATGHPVAGQAVGTAAGAGSTVLGTIGGRKDGDGALKILGDNAGPLSAATSGPVAMAGKNNAAQAIGTGGPDAGFAHKAAQDAVDIKNAPPGERGNAALKKAPNQIGNIGGNLGGGVIPNGGQLSNTISPNTAAGIGGAGGGTGLASALVDLPTSGRKKPGDVEAQNRPSGPRSNSAPMRRRHLARRSLISRQALEREAVLNEMRRRQVWIADNKF